MEFCPTLLNDSFIIKPKVFGDHRGYFYESFNLKEFRKNIGNFDFVQDNEAKSQKDVLRGLHFQNPPFEQGKLCRVIKGAVLDCIVDIRPNSSTYGKHIIVELNEKNKNMLWVPPGFAHGYYTLEDDTIFQYKVTNYYNPESEGCIAWDDPTLNINWTAKSPLISDKDKKGENFKEFKSLF